MTCIGLMSTGCISGTIASAASLSIAFPATPDEAFADAEGIAPFSAQAIDANDAGGIREGSILFFDVDGLLLAVVSDQHSSEIRQRREAMHPL